MGKELKIRKLREKYNKLMKNLTEYEKTYRVYVSIDNDFFNNKIGE